MSQFLYHYHTVEPASWFYLSSLLMIGLFFKFSRFWSVRNLDVVLLILLGPGLLFVYYGKKMERTGLADEAMAIRTEKAPSDATLLDEEEFLEEPSWQDGVALPATDEEVGEPPDEAATEQPSASQRGREVQKYGYLWLFGAGALWTARLLADPTMVRRPLLEPNLSAGGLMFIGCSLFVFLMANVISRSDPAQDQALPQAVMSEADASQPLAAPEPPSQEGPGYALLSQLSTGTHKTLAILAHLMIVLGMVLIGYWHFDNIVMGVGAATLYLMLPYTALMTNEVRHALPAACLVWAILFYRKPAVAGVLLGLAGGITYYPLFLLPLWLSFYWPRGLLRFSMGVVSTLVVLAFLLVVVLMESDDVFRKVRLMFGLVKPAMEGLGGLWDARLDGWSNYYRIPVLAAFVALASSMALWPAQKNLGTLLSCSAAVMVATQFWHGYGGGTYMAWYLPLILLTIFRPNLEDRVALTVLGEGWLPRRWAAVRTANP